MYLKISRVFILLITLSGSLQAQSPTGVTLQQAADFIQKNYASFDIDFYTSIKTGNSVVPLFIASSHTAREEDRSFSLVFMFNDPDPHKVLIFDDPPFTRPVLQQNQLINDKQCRPYQSYFLAANQVDPLIIAQVCEPGQKSEINFMLINPKKIDRVFFHTVLWELSAEGKKEVFVPNTDSSLPQGISPLRGDGRTITVETELKEVSSGKIISYYRRINRILWNGEDVILQQGVWEASR